MHEPKHPSESNNESILARKEIIAPPGFVSVFHETKEQFLKSIDTGGLQIGAEVKNVGGAGWMPRRNSAIDELRPEALRAQGVSRIGNIYAYPFLEIGNGLSGADQRFIKRDINNLKRDFQGFAKYYPDVLVRRGVKTEEEYIAQMNDPAYLKKEYPGEVLEMKVDPDKCYVGDMYFITLIMEDMRYFTEQEAVERNGKEYWKNLITLKDFLTWYRKPEWAENGNDIENADQFKDGEDINTMDYCLLKGAPDGLPKGIREPEILIPQDIPQVHIRLVGN
ncbi:MAG: hypothetical protein KBC81_02135 [Candidatus Pacebacteria bacterium]|nr:hypothetical protein [Candidatus Paceibacterota bacterium]